MLSWCASEAALCFAAPALPSSDAGRDGAAWCGAAATASGKAFIVLLFTGSLVARLSALSALHAVVKSALFALLSAAHARAALPPSTSVPSAESVPAGGCRCGVHLSRLGGVRMPELAKRLVATGAPGAFDAAVQGARTGVA